MTLLLTIQLCLLAGCCTWPWASSSRMLTPGIIPDSIDGVHVTLAFADGSGCSSLVQARLQICRKGE